MSIELTKLTDVCKDASRDPVKITENGQYYYGSFYYRYNILDKVQVTRLSNEQVIQKYVEKHGLAAMLDGLTGEQQNVLLNCHIDNNKEEGFTSYLGTKISALGDYLSSFITPTYDDLG
jgi:hypothetical protein